MLQPLSSTSRVMLVGLSSNEVSNLVISVQAHWNIRPRLMGVPGVANVSVWGERRRQLQVQIDPEVLSAHGVKLEQVISTTGNALWFSPLSFLNASTPGSGGFIDTPNQRLTIQHILPISTPEQLSNVAVEGTPYTLGEIGDIVEHHQPLIGDAILSDGPGVLLVIEKFPWADTSEVTAGLEAALEDLRPSLSGVEIDTSIYRPATFIHDAIENILRAAIIGVPLLLAALIVVLRDWRTILVALISMPVAFLSASAAIAYISAGVDIIMVAGLVAAAGVVVNDATLSAGMLRKGGPRSSEPIPGLVGLALRRSWGTLVFASLVALMATVPMFVVDGVSGAILKSVAMPFAIAVVVSTIVAATLSPALLYVVLSLVPPQPRPAVPQRGRGFLRLPVATAPRPILGLAIMLAIATVVLTVGSGQLAVVPVMKERDVLVDLATTPGTSHPEMMRVTSQILSELREIPGVRRAGAHIGRAITSDAVVNVNSAQIWLNLDTSANHEETLADLGDVINGYPGVASDVLSYSNFKAGQADPESTNTLTVRVFGYGFDKLDSVAKLIVDELSEIDRLDNVRIRDNVMEPVVIIEADLEKAKKFGIKPGDVRRAAAVVLSGLEVGSLFEDQKIFEVVVWGEPEVRGSVTGIRDILIDTPKGGLVRLGDVADVSIGTLPQTIWRDAASRYLDVTADVTNGSLEAAAAEIEDRIGQLAFPLEYHAELQTDYDERASNRDRLILAAIGSAIAIFLLIQAAVASWRLGFSLFVALIAALSGGLIVVAATGWILTLGAVAGLLAAFGVASRGALALVRRYQELEREGGAFGAELIADGTRDRIGSIVAACVGTALAVAPAAVMASAPGLETLGPLAMVLIGGLITTVLVNLIVVPALYLLFGGGSAAAETELASREGEFNAA
jgi:Cu/Ag efflux pump CusA